MHWPASGPENLYHADQPTDAPLDLGVWPDRWQRVTEGAPRDESASHLDARRSDRLAGPRARLHLVPAAVVNQQTALRVCHAHLPHRGQFCRSDYPKAIVAFRKRAHCNGVLYVRRRTGKGPSEYQLHLQ